MAERRAVNKYYPPGWDPSKGSANKYQKSHPLRSRAKKIDEGILVIRFGMPFDVWCLGCESLIAAGVRFNAEKSKSGNYLTIPIYKFKMKCPHCGSHFQLQTDPAHSSYTVLDGARKKIRPTEDEESGQIVIDEEEKERRLTDAMFRLEKQAEDLAKSEARLPSLNDLQESRFRWSDSFGANQLLRSQFRLRRKKIEESEAKDREVLKRTSLKIPLVRPRQSDRIEAETALHQRRLDKLNQSESSRKRDILNSKLSLAPPKLTFKKDKKEQSPAPSNRTRLSRIKR